MAQDQEQRLGTLLARFNEPVIPEDSLQRWLRQFASGDHGIALRLLECIEFHGYRRLQAECRQLHHQLMADLGARGFDTEHYRDIDFSRAFTGKSGDLISYLYRRANRIPVTAFHSIEALHERRASLGERALVILDDYIGTGSQFLLQFLARSPGDIALLNAYAVFRVGAIAVHDDARHKQQLLAQGDIDALMAIEEQELACIDFSHDRQQLLEALASVEWDSGGLEAVARDFPVNQHPSLNEDERQQLNDFLQRSGAVAFESVTGFLLGHHTFFYGAPNALPQLLLPLFRRVEDFTSYDTSVQQGLPCDIIDYDIANPEPITRLYPRQPG